MMNMVMAAKQWDEDQRRYQDTLRQRDFGNALDLARTQAYIQNVTEPNQAGPTEMMRNWQFLEGQYPGQDIGPMIVPGLRERQASEYNYDVDPETAARIEKDFGFPSGTVAQMGPRQRADVNQQWLNRRFPTSGSSATANSAVARQKEVLNTLLADIEQRRSSTESKASRERYDMGSKFDPVPSQRAMAGYDRQVQIIRDGLMRLAATNTAMSQTEWDELNKKLSTGGGYSQLAQEIASEMGIPVELAEQYVQKAMSGTPTGVRKVE
jgi:hypothetical protein